MYLAKLQQELDTKGPKSLQETQSLKIGPESQGVEKPKRASEKAESMWGKPSYFHAQVKKIK